MWIFVKFVDIIVASLVFSFSYFRKSRQRTIEQLGKLKIGLAQETVETKQMMRAYRDFLAGRATREEMQVANEQLRDVIKTMGLGALLVLPGSVLTLPVLVKLAERFGINIFPSAFKKDDEGSA